MSNGDRFRILALDGGGVKGVFSAAVLAALEDDVGIEHKRKEVDEVERQNKHYQNTKGAYRA